MKKYTLLLLLLLLVACGGAGNEVDEGGNADVPTATSEMADDMTDDVDEPTMTFWEDTLIQARGQEVNFYMWGGSDLINNWVTGYVAQSVKEQYDITLNLVPITDATEYINKVLGEKQAGQDENGTVDLVWVNGENFRTMRQGELLYGYWTGELPNMAYVNTADPSVANDFGFPVDEHESPYGKAQFVMIYDSARIAEPPQTIGALVEWIKANPGLFTYPAPPDFTGSAFVRHVCYEAVGSYEKLLGEFDQAVFDAELPACWELLNEIESFLWREGQTYPESHTRQQELFANGEVWFDMAYNPAEASSLIENGRYPETTRTFVFETGTIANTHYVAIPYNSSHKAAAMVVANFLLSPEAQLSKAQPENWGDLPVLDPALLPPEWQAQFAAIPRGVATLSTEELAAARLPELQAPWLTAMEQGWEAEVLQQ